MTVYNIYFLVSWLFNFIKNIFCESLHRSHIIFFIYFDSSMELCVVVSILSFIWPETKGDRNSFKYEVKTIFFHLRYFLEIQDFDFSFPM